MKLHLAAVEEKVQVCRVVRMLHIVLPVMTLGSLKGMSHNAIKELKQTFSAACVCTLRRAGWLEEPAGVPNRALGRCKEKNRCEDPI